MFTTGILNSFSAELKHKAKIFARATEFSQPQFGEQRRETPKWRPGKKPLYGNDLISLGSSNLLY